VVIAPHRLAVGRCVDEMSGGLGGFELKIDGEGGRGPEAVQDRAGLEACGVAGEDLGVAPDRDNAVGLGVVVGAWEEGGDRESWNFRSVLPVRCRLDYSLSKLTVPPVGHCGQASVSEVVRSQRHHSDLQADVVGSEGRE
jgi:hypothetical protein